MGRRSGEIEEAASDKGAMAIHGNVAAGEERQAAGEIGHHQHRCKAEAGEERQTGENWRPTQTVFKQKAGKAGEENRLIFSKTSHLSRITLYMARL